MTDQEINAAIAEWCGWQDIYAVNNKLCGLPPHGYFKASEMMYHTDIPDYLNDLNAMHKAEDTLTPDQLTEYCNRLTAPVSAVGIPHKSKGIRATARQRAEAFLRTLNLYKF
jgi:hypothetical protein